MKSYYCLLPNNQTNDLKLKPETTTTTTDHNNESCSSNPCYHLLDLFRRNFLGNECSNNSSIAQVVDTENLERTKHDKVSVRDVKEVIASFRNVKELMAAGICIKRNPTHHMRDISFYSNGITVCLKIPPITIDSSTKAMFLNLIAN